jgi:hypothetical protein
MTRRPERLELRLAPDRLEFGGDGVPWPTMPMDQPTNGHHAGEPPGRPFVPATWALKIRVTVVLQPQPHSQRG